MIRRKKKVVLALGAGGARGLAHIGVLRALKEKGVPIDAIAGVSFGAIVGALYSVYLDVDLVERKLKEYVNDPLFRDTAPEMNQRQADQSRSFLERIQGTIKQGYFFSRALSRTSLVTPEDFVGNMRKLLGDLSFADMQLPFRCQSVDLLTGAPVVHSDGDLLLALTASCAAPGFFPPVEHAGMMLVDGGIAEMVPHHLAQTFSPDYVIGVDVTRNLEVISDPASDIHHSLDVVFRSYDITRDYMNVYVDRTFDCIIRPQVGSYSWVNFEYFDAYVEAGYNAALDKASIINHKVHWRLF